MKQLNIFGRIAKINRRDGLMQQSNVAGYFEWEKFEITIDSSLSGDEFMHTLLHEAIHAMWCRLGLIQAQVSHDVHELICENVATIMLENFTIKEKTSKKKKA